MNKTVIRIQNVKLHNYKNVEYGNVVFPYSLGDNLFESGSDILGIYGQNGSGKTAFIRSLTLLKLLFTGQSLPDDTVNYITERKNNCRLEFLFSLQNDSDFYKIYYTFTIGDPAKHTAEILSPDNPVIIVHEKLKYAKFLQGRWKPFTTLMEYRADSTQILLPKVRLRELANGIRDNTDFLRIAKKSAIKQSTSFIFSSDIRNFLNRNENHKKVYGNIINKLYHYAKNQLYIIDNRGMGLIHAHLVLPLNNLYGTVPHYLKRIYGGNYSIPLDKASAIPSALYSDAEKIISSMNIVLSKVIPSFSIKIKKIGEQILNDGLPGVIIELMSRRKEVEVPLRYESDGIKKIISVMHMLIQLYNSPSMTLAVDELDSGIFEYLLGEILKVIDETGQGQLVFTSHNLRPLETLSKNSILFTTTNPANRYIRFANLKSRKNLRDFYYHDIILGGQKECIYEATNTFSISRAFRIADK